MKSPVTIGGFDLTTRVSTAISKKNHFTGDFRYYVNVCLSVRVSGEILCIQI